MKLLLDTHTLVWWETDPTRIPVGTRDLLKNSAHETLISVVSFWELVIKIQVGKFLFAGDLLAVAEKQVSNGLTLLPVMIEHIHSLGALPLIHKDPFVRLLIAQAIAESALLVSADGIFARYPVPVIW